MSDLGNVQSRPGRTLGLLLAAAVLAIVAMPTAVAGAQHMTKQIRTLSKVEVTLAKRLSAIEARAAALEARSGDARPQGPVGPVGPAGPDGPKGNPGRLTGDAGGDLTGTYPNPRIADAAVLTANILDGTILSADLAQGAITAANLAEGAVTASKIADGAVTSATIADGAVTSAKVLDGAIGSADVGDGTLTGTDFAEFTIGEADLADGSVHGAQLGEAFVVEGARGEVRPFGDTTLLRGTCPPGSRLLSGGGIWETSDTRELTIEVSHPTAVPNQWIVTGVNNRAQTVGKMFVLELLCLRI